MATRKSSTPREQRAPARLVRPRKEIGDALEVRIAFGRDLLALQVHNEESLASARRDYLKWDEYNATLLERAFSDDSEHRKYAARPRIVVMSAGTDPLHERIDDYQNDVSKKIRRLESLSERLELFELDPTLSAEQRAAEPKARSRVTPSEQTVFVVHGHDGARREELARLIARLIGKEPIILHEQASRGNTLIEKFEEHGARAGFAIALLTPDDEGRSRGHENATLQPRGRQNVIFEAGYFIGKLGRERTAIVYEPRVELPSDLDGIVYVELDAAGAWHLKIARELRAAGLPVDMNNL